MIVSEASVLYYLQESIRESKCDCWVVPVACDGVIERGGLVEFISSRVGAHYAVKYHDDCAEGRIRFGALRTFYFGVGRHPKIVINMPVRHTTKTKANLMVIKAGLRRVAPAVEVFQQKSVAIPSITVGEYQWDVIEDYLADLADELGLEMAVEVYLGEDV